ncbi:hypothetical protein CEXT_11571 [Caerostris extrusa]|uniref:Uncharacterized protein n=1 Tax=Caerostris extrusa TaxID=172846 RepID=A0AAV4XC84_CAEEX|nr:hypothetical protein CEXT_11571 [Caerostris extrusa]
MESRKNFSYRGRNFHQYFQVPSDLKSPKKEKNILFRKISPRGVIYHQNPLRTNIHFYRKNNKFSPSNLFFSFCDQSVSLRNAHSLSFSHVVNLFGKKIQSHMFAVGAVGPRVPSE